MAFGLNLLLTLIIAFHGALAEEFCFNLDGEEKECTYGCCGDFDEYCCPNVARIVGLVIGIPVPVCVFTAIVFLCCHHRTRGVVYQTYAHRVMPSIQPVMLQTAAAPPGVMHNQARPVVPYPTAGAPPPYSTGGIPPPYSTAGAPPPYSTAGIPPAEVQPPYQVTTPDKRDQLHMHSGDTTAQ